MYTLQDTTSEIILENGAKHNPIATLKNEYGGIAQICMDDHCYVLYLGGEREDQGQPYRITSHWFKEAIDAFYQVLPYEDSNKIDDSLLMIAISYFKLGNQDAAKDYFHELITKFPESEYVPRAKRYLAELLLVTDRQ